MDCDGDEEYPRIGTWVLFEYLNDMIVKERRDAFRRTGFHEAKPEKVLPITFTKSPSHGIALVDQAGVVEYPIYPILKPAKGPEVHNKAVLIELRCSELEVELPGVTVDESTVSGVCVLAMGEGDVPIDLFDGVHITWRSLSCRIPDRSTRAGL